MGGRIAAAVRAHLTGKTGRHEPFQAQEEQLVPVPRRSRLQASFVVVQRERAQLFGNDHPVAVHVGLGEPPSGFDRADAKQVHLDGLSLSRAWCLRRLGFAEAAERHLAAALPHLEDDYVGTHWLASFALLALTEG